MLKPVDTSKFDDAKGLLARLMAQENIVVQFLSGLHTANFDMVSRVMSIPAEWMSTLTVDQIDLLIGHETGHAKHTDIKYIKTITDARKLKKHPGLMSYFNVVEDARIERKQREAYPGLKASFYNGYKDFTQNGPIFRIKGSRVDGNVVNEMKLIDRINVFYKLGAFIQVPFAPEEHQWIDLIDKAWSTERAMEVAGMLHELAKDEILEEQKKQKEQQKNQPKQKPEKGGQAEAGDGEESDDEDDDANDDDKKSSKGKKQDDKDEKDSDKSDEDGDKSDDDKDKSEDGDDKSEGDGDKSDDGDDTDEDGDDTDGDDSDTESDDSDTESDGDDTESDDSDTESDGDDTDADAKAAREALDPESETDKALTEALKKLAADNRPDPTQQIRHLLLKPLDDATVKARTITARTWADAAMNAVSRVQFATETIKHIETEWHARYDATVDHMAQEFMRKKLAKNLAHARTGKSGKLDMTKLAKYRFAEDLFKRVTTVPDGQSHGLVMMIDGSSSMKNVFGAVLDQVLLFALFAHKVNIPFECYMFTDGADNFYGDAAGSGLQTITLPQTGKLVGLVNTVADRAGFQKQVQAVLAFRCKFVTEHTKDGHVANIPNVPYSDLNMTPLYAGMMVMERHVERMKRTLHLDKVMAVVISDGDDNGGLLYESQHVNKDGSVSRGMSHVGETAVVVRDTVTKKNHVLVESVVDTEHFGAEPTESYRMPDTGVMTLLFDAMKARHGCRSIWLYLVGSGNSVSRSSGPHAATKSMVRSDKVFAVHVDAVNKSMDTSKQFVLPVDQSICDCAMVVEPAALKLAENEFAKVPAAGSQFNQAYVVDQYLKASVKAQANRVFVNSLMPFIA